MFTLTESHHHGRKKDHLRSRTTPVNREDILSGLSSASTPPPVYARRRSEPQSTGTLSMQGYHFWNDRLKIMICEKMVLTGYMYTSLVHW